MDDLKPRIACGGVAFAGLSRLQNDPPRDKRYFLEIYALVIPLTAPTTPLLILLGQRAFFADILQTFRPARQLPAAST